MKRPIPSGRLVLVAPGVDPWGENLDNRRLAREMPRALAAVIEIS